MSLMQQRFKDKQQFFLKQSNTMNCCKRGLNGRAIGRAIDKHSKRLIVSNIELLNYCTGFYERQFITRENVHKGILERF